MFLVIIVLFILVGVVALYNAHFQYHATGMVKWLGEQYYVIEQYSDYLEEAHNLLHKDIPQVNQWLQESKKYMFGSCSVQMMNSILIYIVIFDEPTKILLFIAAVSNAALFASVGILRKRRYIVEGMCHGTQAILEAIEIQKSNKSSKPTT